MCNECLSPGIKGASRDLDDKPFGTVRDGSMGHGGIAMADNPKFEGESSQNMKFEGMPSKSSSDATQVERSGFGS